MNLSLCLDSLPQVLGIFDPSIAPKLLFYAYIPIALLSMVFAFFVLIKDNYSPQAKLFWGMNISFSIWILLIMFQWIAVHVQVVQLAWQLLIIPEVSIYLFAISFCYEFLFKRTPPKIFTYLILICFIVIAIVLPTKFNIESFDLNNCEGVIGVVWNYVYIIELAFLSLIGLMCFEKFKISRNNNEKISSIFLPVGLIFFLGVFWASNFFAELSKFYEINLVGPIGMVVFMTVLTYIIVKFKAFNIKLFTSQVLVFSLWILTGALLFIENINTSRVVVICTLLLLFIFGYALIKSVRREIEQREKIEKLAIDLQTANDGQTNLIHIINHQIKGYIAKSRNIFSELLTEPTYGPVSDAAKPMIKEGFNSLTEGVDFVQQILNASNIEKGTMSYFMQPLDIKKVVQEVTEKQKPLAEAKCLSIEMTFGEGNFEIEGDRAQLKEAIRNLIDNSINYTPKGSITIQLVKNASSIVLSIKDTGIGITDEDKKRLFTKGGKGKNSTKVNVNSSGYGLSFVKGVVEAHKGKVWAESEGHEKGSTFYLELPI